MDGWPYGKIVVISKEIISLRYMRNGNTPGKINYAECGKEIHFICYEDDNEGLIQEDGSDDHQNEEMAEFDTKY